MKAGDWVMCCPFWFLSLCLVLEYFSTVLPISTYESRIEWCAAPLFLSLCLVLRVFSTVLPNFYLWKQDWVMCCSFVIPSLCLVLTVPTVPTYGRGLSDVLLFCDSFLTFGLRVFFNSPTQFLPESRDWVMCCSFVIPFFCLVLKVFFSPISTYESRDWVMCCSLWFLSRLVLRVFFNSPISTYEKQGLSDVLLFVIPFFVFGLRVFFNSPTQFLPIKAGIEWCAALLWFLSLCLVLRVFSTVLPNTYESRDWVMCCSLCDSFISLCLVLEYFQQSYPISTAGIEWCAALCDFFRLVLRVFSTVLPNFYLWKQGLSDVLLFCDSFLCGLKSIFNSPTQFLPMKAGIGVLPLWFLFWFGLKSIFNSPTQFLPMKQGLVMCCSLWFLSLCWS
jgi:hypothetical protein